MAGVANPIIVRQGLLATACVLALGLSAPSSPAQERGIVYVRALTGSAELRLYRPGAADELVARLDGSPTNLFWDEDITTLFFRTDTSVFRLPWVDSATPERILQGVPEADELWIDPSTGRWRGYEIVLPQAGANTTYLARIHEHEDVGGWRVIAERATDGCEAGDGSMCGEEVSAYRDGKHGVFVSDLYEQMRVRAHLARLGIEYDGDKENETQFLPLSEDGSYGIALRVQLGDTLHGMAPVQWVERKTGAQKTIYGDDTPCGKQVAFERDSSWLLVASEYTGRCARVVSMSDGEILWRAPAGSSMAAWITVPRPQP